jgi:hypothetical protein
MLMRWWGLPLVARLAMERERQASNSIRLSVRFRS